MATHGTNDRAIVDDIKGRAVDVVAAHEAYLAAWMADRDAHAELLQEVARVVEPALPALSSRVVVSWVRSGAGVVTDQASWRGFPLLTDAGGPLGEPRVDRGGDPARGRFSGRTLFLNMEAEFVELVYDGTWSSVAGELSTWRATTVAKSLVAVANEWEVDAVLERIAAALSEQQGGAKPEKTRHMLERAGRIRALARFARSL